MGLLVRRAGSQGCQISGYNKNPLKTFNKCPKAKGMTV